MLPTILDVVDNFFGTETDLLRVPGRRLMEFGAEVRRFADFYDPPLLDPAQHPTYIGGWPSANFWFGLGGDLLMSSLLYSGHLVARDPISDWFANERYRLPALSRARPGYLRAGGAPAIAETRQFLLNVIPELKRMRPLIERGIVVLVPARRFFFEHRADVDALCNHLAARLASEPLAISRHFDPADVAVEDNVRGYFVFAGGNREEQLSRAITDSLKFFAGEYQLARWFDADYAAPFEYEQFLCAEGLEAELLATPGRRVLHAVLHSRLPVFSRLTPTLVASLRDDENFGAFRSELYEAYRDIPGNASQEEIDGAISEAERASLVPRLEAAEREVDRGSLATIVDLAGFSLRVATSLGVGAATAKAGLPAQVGAVTASETAWSVLGRRRRTRPEPVLTVWKKLFAHSRLIQEEMSNVVAASTHQRDEYWGIPEKPSMNVVVTNGLLFMDYMPTFDRPEKPGGSSDPYLPCSCGSGEKWKFCCKGIR